MSPDDPVVDMLTPEGAPLADPAQVERALAALWKPPPDQADAEVATRVCAGNLIAVGRSEDWSELSGVLGALSPAYPSRTLVLLVDGADARGVRASVSALCHVPQPGRPQVCCEQIVLRTGTPDGPDGVHTMLPLLEPDVPTAAWWTLDPQAFSRMLEAVRAVVDRLIMDAGVAGLAPATPGGRCAVRELGWYRIYRFRELIAGMFDGPAAGATAAIEHVAIATGGDSEEGGVDACWLAAFLAGQLGWQPRRRDGDGRFVFDAGPRRLEVVLRAAGGDRPGLESLIIRCRGSDYEIARAPGTTGPYRIVEHDAHVCQMPRCVEAGPVDRAGALALALTGRPADPAFARAAPIAAWLAGHP